MQTNGIIHIDDQELNKTIQFKFPKVPCHLRGRYLSGCPSSCQCSMDEVASGTLEWLEHSNPSQGQCLQNGHSPWGVVWSRMLADDDEAGAGAPCHGNEDVAMVIRNLSAQSSHEQRWDWFPLPTSCMKRDCGGSVMLCIVTNIQSPRLLSNSTLKIATRKERLDCPKLGIL